MHTWLNLHIIPMFLLLHKFIYFLFSFLHGFLYLNLPLNMWYWKNFLFKLGNLSQFSVTQFPVFSATDVYSQYLNIQLYQNNKVFLYFYQISLVYCYIYYSKFKYIFVYFLNSYCLHCWLFWKGHISRLNAEVANIAL